MWQVGLVLLGVVLVFLILFQIVEPEPTLEEPAAGGAYVEGVLGYWRVINPILAPQLVQANQPDQDLTALVFDGLTTLDETGRVVPALAPDWERSDDGTVYDFHLRDDVRWHDGAPFTASDVTFTIQAIQDGEYQGDPSLRELWRNVTVEQVGDDVVRFTLAEPFPSFLSYTTIGLLPAHLLSDVPATDLPEHPFTTDHPVGTGMFMAESVSPDRVTLVANPYYWKDQPFLDGLEFWFYADEDGLLADFERGEIDGFQVNRSESLEELSGLADLRLYSALSAGYGIIYLNLEREDLPFLQEREIRQALLYGLDRQALIDDLLAGRGLLADSPIPPTSWAYDPSVKHYRFDPERAIGLLDAAGWVDSDADRVRDKEGVSLGFTLQVSEDPELALLADEIARSWQALGMAVEVQVSGGPDLLEAIRSRVFDAVLTEVRLSADPDPYPLWHSTQAADPGQNFAGFANESADLVMEQARFEVERERRLELYHDFQQIFAEEVPSLVLYYPIYSYAVNTRVEGVQLSPLLYASDRFRNVAEWYKETAEIVVSDHEQLDNRDN